MVKGAQMVYSCMEGCEGPWREGDALYVCFTRSQAPIVRVDADGHQRSFGAHMFPVLFRDFQAGLMRAVWQDQVSYRAHQSAFEAEVSDEPPRMRAG